MSNQKLLYPEEYVGNSQGSYGTYSHKNVEALDTAGKDYTAENYYSCGEGIISYADDNETWATYKNVIDRFHNFYPQISVGAFHSPLNGDRRIGDILHTWEIYSKEGKLGNATGNHKHNVITIKAPDWSYKTKYLPENFFFLKRGLHKFKHNNSKYDHTWICDEQNLTKKQLKVNIDNLGIRQDHNITSQRLGWAEKGYWNIIDTFDDGKYIWCLVYAANGECLPMWIAHHPDWSEIINSTPIAKTELFDVGTNYVKIRYITYAEVDTPQIRLWNAGAWGEWRTAVGNPVLLNRKDDDTYLNPGVNGYGVQMRFRHPASGLWIECDPIYFDTLPAQPEPPIELIIFDKEIFSYNITKTGKYYINLNKDEILKIYNQENEIFKYIVVSTGKYYINLNKDEILKILIKI